MGLREYLALSSTLTSRVIVFNWNIQFADRGMIVQQELSWVVLLVHSSHNLPISLGIPTSSR